MVLHFGIRVWVGCFNMGLLGFVWDQSVGGLFLCGIEGVGRMVMCSVE